MVESRRKTAAWRFWMAEKYYAVKTGAETGIFTTWEECRASVHGYSGAASKSFKTREEAAA